MYYIVKMLETGKIIIGSEGMHIDGKAVMVGSAESMDEAMGIVQNEMPSGKDNYYIEDMDNGASIIR